MVARSTSPEPIGKYCRMCWNTANWQHPTGEAAHLEMSSYVSEMGFGHEEWLLDTAWPLSGYRGSSLQFTYGFLQPIGKYRQTYIGRTFDVCLYTVSPDKVRLAVGIIRNIYVPDDDELKWMLTELARNGRLEKMNADLRRINLPEYDFGSSSPSGGVVAGPASVANVRFRSSDIEIFDFKRPFPASHSTNRINRYQPLDWDGDSPSPIETVPPLPYPSQLGEPHPERSESLRHRAAIAGTVYSPEHIRLQNELYRWLKANYGEASVRYEENFVDLTLKSPRGDTFFEIKTAPTVKACLRESLGQLLEYSHYSQRSMAAQLVVVGTPVPSASDVAYLSHLRNLYSLPLSYRRWSWESKSLEPQV